MSKEKSKPIRMCVVCKKRFLQNELSRYSITDNKIKEYVRFGRSIYLCFMCKEKNKEKVIKILSGKYKIDADGLKLFLNADL